jgi:hypothetical protein
MLHSSRPSGREEKKQELHEVAQKYNEIRIKKTEEGKETKSAKETKYFST